MKNDDLHLEPHVREARMSIARQLFAHQADYLKSAATTAARESDGTMPDADANDDERTRAVGHVAELLAAHPRYTSRRGHYLPYGLRAAG
jgi:uncharacterized protein YciW